MHEPMRARERRDGEREKTQFWKWENKQKDSNMLIGLGAVESYLSAGEKSQWEGMRKQQANFEVEPQKGLE